MANPSGKYWIDGMDLWTIFGIAVESGSDDLLKFPSKKDSITHDWLDSNGIDVDLSRVFFTDRQITLRFGIIADNETDFWQKYGAFFAQLGLPNLRRLEVNELGPRSFYVYYKECSAFTRFTRILVQGQEKVACKFTMVLVEPAPQVNNNSVFIVDEDGRFLVT